VPRHSHDRSMWFIVYLLTHYASLAFESRVIVKLDRI
jgi:hypothetical protein